MPDADVTSVLVRPCPEPKFGDYQTNALIGLAKRNQLNPREFAAQVVDKLALDDCCEPVGIAGPGFLNFRLKTEAISDALVSAAMLTIILSISLGESFMQHPTCKEFYHSS